MKTIAALYMSACAVLFACGAASAASISLLPASQTVAPGAVATYVLSAQWGQNDLPVGSGVSGFSVSIAFNPLIAAVDGWTFGSLLGGPLERSDQTDGGTPGEFLISSVSDLGAAALLPAQGNGPISLATIRFRGLSPGTTALSLSEPAFSLWLTPAQDVFSPYAPTAFVDASLTVRGTGTSVVPLPASLLLFGAGLAGLMVPLRLHRKR